jgi:inorganic triphosphatase YgiF
MRVKSAMRQGARSDQTRQRRIPPREIELKLAAAPRDLSVLKRALEAMGKRSGTAGSTLVSTYYDSPDLPLRRHHLTLRVREQEGRYIQTVKTGDLMTADLISRGEWEDVIASDRPDLDAPETGRLLAHKLDKDNLRPLFRTIVRRTVIELEPDASTRIEAAIDEGEIRALEGEAVEPVSEIELELKGGDPAAIYDVALRLLDVAPLRIEMRSKAERGYELMAGDGQAPAPVRLKPITLDAVMTVEMVLQSIGRRCLAHLLHNEPAALADKPEGIHQMRVAVRRLRSVLSALKPMLPAEPYRWASDELKWLAGALGSARNWDVFAANLVEPVERVLPFEHDLKLLAEAAERRRRTAYDRAKQAILSREHTAAILRLVRWFEARGWRDQPVSERAVLLLATVGEVGPGLIERRWRQSRKRSKRFDELTPAQRHKLRIALKKLRYTIEFLRNLFEKGKVKAFMRLLTPLQDDLGQINDVRTAHELLAEVTRHADQSNDAVARAGGIVLGWHERTLTDLEPKLRKHVRRLRRVKPFWPRNPPYPGQALVILGRSHAQLDRLRRRESTTS